MLIYIYQNLQFARVINDQVFKDDNKLIITKKS